MDKIYWIKLINSFFSSKYMKRFQLRMIKLIKNRVQKIYSRKSVYKTLTRHIDKTLSSFYLNETWWTKNVGRKKATQKMKY